VRSKLEKEKRKVCGSSPEVLRFVNYEKRGLRNGAKQWKDITKIKENKRSA